LLSSLFNRDILLLIHDNSEERWRSEGIQVGGLNTRRGVVGTWFDKDYDPHGPAGPTAFWKVTDKSFNKMEVEMAGSGEETDSDEDW